MNDLRLELGVKSDPIEYRYSFPWLFRLMREENIRFLQLGTFFEIYQLPDDWFVRLTETAAEFGIRITSVFTAHRELGGLFFPDPARHDVARRNLRRLVEIGSLVGAECVGHNAGAVPRDELPDKPHGMRRHLDFMKELLEFAGEVGVGALTLEPMSCLAEPPSTPDEIRTVGDELARWVAAPSRTASFGYCIDVSHGVADPTGKVVHDSRSLLEAALPWLRELHLKNTDARFEHTFGFTPAEVVQGRVDLAETRAFLRENAALLPVSNLIGYLEIGGPKLGRDYSDPRLEIMLRQSIRHLRETFASEITAPASSDPGGARTISADVVSLPNHDGNTLCKSAPSPARNSSRSGPRKNGRPCRSNGAAGPSVDSINDGAWTPRHIWAAPSLMCCDLRRAGAAVEKLESLGVDCLHFDIMDAHFTPNMPLGFELMYQLRKVTPLPIDVHLMVDDPAFFVEKSLDAGADMISIHAEATSHLDRALTRIQEAGTRAGVALNPATPLSALDWILDRIDFVLVMTVNPGFAGQTMVPGALRKIAECRRFLDDNGARNVRVQVDGNVSLANISDMVAAGGDILVLGSSSLFRLSETLEVNWDRTRAAIRHGQVARDQAKQAETDTSAKRIL